MGNQIALTFENSDAFRAACDSLCLQLEELARLTDHYPVICMIDGNKYVFKNRNDIETLIERIKAALDKLDKSA